MTSITDVLHHLVRRGLALRIETNGTLFIYDPRRCTREADVVVGRHLPAETQALSARAERRLLEEARLALTRAVPTSTGAAPVPAPGTTTMCSASPSAQPEMPPGAASTASTAARKVIVLPEPDRIFAPTGAQWRGITWLDVPGHDVHIKKLNFALLKRGKLKGYKECAALHGMALRQRLNEISERNRVNSHKRQHETRLRDKSTPRPKPP